MLAIQFWENKMKPEWAWPASLLWFLKVLRIYCHHIYKIYKFSLANFKLQKEQWGEEHDYIRLLKWKDQNYIEASKYNPKLARCPSQSAIESLILAEAHPAFTKKIITLPRNIF